MTPLCSLSSLPVPLVDSGVATSLHRYECPPALFPCPHPPYKHEQRNFSRFLVGFDSFQPFFLVVQPSGRRDLWRRAERVWNTTGLLGWAGPLLLCLTPSLLDGSCPMSIWQHGNVLMRFVQCPTLSAAFRSSPRDPRSRSSVRSHADMATTQTESSCAPTSLEEVLDHRFWLCSIVGKSAPSKVSTGLI